MGVPKPGSSAAAVTAIETRAPRAAPPVESIDELDTETLATLLDDVQRHEKIVQWFSTGGSALIVGVSMASIYDLLPAGGAGVAVHLGVTVVALACTGGYLLSQHQNWRRECAALGLSKAQASELRRRLKAARQKVVQKTRHLTAGERNAVVIEAMQEPKPTLPARHDA